MADNSAATFYLIKWEVNLVYICFETDWHGPRSTVQAIVLS